MGQMHMSNYLESVIQKYLYPDNYGLFKLNYNGYSLSTMKKTFTLSSVEILICKGVFFAKPRNMDQIHINNDLLSVIQNFLGPESFGL